MMDYSKTDKELFSEALFNQCFGDLSEAEQRKIKPKLKAIEDIIGL